MSSQYVNLFCSVMRAQNQVSNSHQNLYFKNSAIHKSAFEPRTHIFSTFYIRAVPNLLNYLNDKQ